MKKNDIETLQELMVQVNQYINTICPDSKERRFWKTKLISQLVIFILRENKKVNEAGNFLIEVDEIENVLEDAKETIFDVGTWI